MGSIHSYKLKLRAIAPSAQVSWFGGWAVGAAGRGKASFKSRNALFATPFPSHRYVILKHVNTALSGRTRQKDRHQKPDQLLTRWYPPAIASLLPASFCSSAYPQPVESCATRQQQCQHPHQPPLGGPSRRPAVVPPTTEPCLASPGASIS